ncbi:hypothetical protein NZ027_25575, partial [Escherichia coli]|nr:hypothetical protein [Escherichia coli]
GWDKHFQANTVRNRNVLSTVRLGMEVLRHSGYTITREALLQIVGGDKLIIPFC